MALRTVTDTFSVSPQLTPADLGEVKAAGFTGLIINRPDGEGEGQPSSMQMREAAQGLGLSVAYVPMPLGTDPARHAPAFRAAINGMAGPVVAYCKSGMRSEMIWAAAQQIG